MAGVHETLGREGVRATVVSVAHPTVQCANVAVPSRMVRIIVIAGDLFAWKTSA